MQTYDSWRDILKDMLVKMLRRDLSAVEEQLLCEKIKTLQVGVAHLFTLVGFTSPFPSFRLSFLH
jgi:hypothetical protein